MVVLLSAPVTLTLEARLFGAPSLVMRLMRLLALCGLHGSLNHGRTS